ncbi:MAG TPA: MFS transporter [Gemmataceae bacterium]|nr:MFS transporter [Gemmataceae bacterium]
MRYTLLSFLCVATVIAYVQRSALAVPAKTIEGELGLRPQDMGLVMSVWYWAYALGQLPAGWLADRIGSKPALVLFAVLWSALTGIVGLAGGFVGLMLLWGLMGCAQAGIFPCCTKAIGSTFPRTGQAFASGMLACCMSLGAAIAQKLTGALLGPLTWQEIFALYAVPGLAWALVFALVVPRPEPPAPPPETDAPDDWAALPPPVASATSPAPWWKLVTDAQMQLLCAQQFLRASAVAFFYTWFPRFLQETKGLNSGEAGALAAWPPLAGMCGGLLGGVFSDWLLRRTGNARLSRQGMATAAMVVCAAAGLAAYLATDAVTVVVLLCVAGFFGMVGGVSGYSVAIAFGGKRVATVFATMNMSGNVGAAVFPLAVGFLVASTGDWNNALLLFAGLFAADAVCWVLLNPKGTLFDDTDPPR